MFFLPKGGGGRLGEENFGTPLGGWVGGWVGDEPYKLVASVGAREGRLRVPNFSGRGIRRLGRGAFALPPPTLTYVFNLDVP